MANADFIKKIVEKCSGKMSVFLGAGASMSIGFGQYFYGGTYFQTGFPCNGTSLGIWRQRIGEEKLKRILEETVRNATNLSKLPMYCTAQYLTPIPCRAVTSEIILCPC